MAERQKRKLRRTRITDLGELGLESGKLYSFQGRFRYLYKEKRAVYNQVHTKIKRNDYVMFLEADLWQSKATKKKIVNTRAASKIEKQLKESGFTVIGRRKHGWRRNNVQIDYKPKVPIYSGMLYIGFEDKFGWINIVGMTKEAILRQFNKVDLGNE